MIRRFINRLFPSERAATKETLGHPGSGVIGWMGGGKETSGIHVDENVAMTYSVVWAATRLLSATGACLPLNLYRKTASGKTLATDHSLFRILHDQPNTKMSSFMFRSTQIGLQVNRGNAYAEIERTNGGEVLELHPIHPTNVTPRELDDGSIVYEIRSRGKTSGVIPAANMLHIPSMISDDGVIGKGVVQKARETIGFGIATEQHGAAFFGNGARPSVLLKHPGRLKPDTRENLRKEWLDVHGGPAQAGKPAVLSEGMDVASLSLSAEDSQFLQTRQHNVEEVARWYGVPPHMIGHLLRSTFNNIETQSIEFVTYSLIPWLKLWEQEVWRKLLSTEEQSELFVKHEVDALLRGNAENRSNALKTQFMHGALTIDEWREMEDRNPLGGDVGAAHFVPTNLTTAELVASGLGPEPTSGGFGGTENDPDGAEHHPPLVDLSAMTQKVEESLTTMSGVLESQQQFAVTLDKRVATLAAELDATQSMLTTNATRWLSNDLARMLRKESMAACRAAKKPADFSKWLDTFYESHRDTMREALLEPARACNAANKIHAAIDSHIELSKSQLLEATECQAEELASNIATCVKDWEQRAHDLTFYLGEENDDIQ